MGQFRSMKARELLRVLMREPLGYEFHRGDGSHMRLRSKDRPDLLFAFHDGQTVPPLLVKKILVKDVGLSVEEAQSLL